MIDTVKSFMLNEMELIFFSIYLEKINWLCGIITLTDNITLVALYIKVNI